MDHFISIGGYHLNLFSISMIDCRKPGVTTIHVGSSSLTFEGADDLQLRKLYPAPEVVPTEGQATAVEAAASLEHAKSLWDAPPSFAPATSTAIPTHPVPPPVRSL